MAKFSKHFLILGIILFCASAATRLWVGGAEYQANEFGKFGLQHLPSLGIEGFRKLPSDSKNFTEDINEALTLGGTAKWTFIDSKPSGAQLLNDVDTWNNGPLKAPNHTPTLVSAQTERITLTTPYRSGEFALADCRNASVQLALKMPFSVLFHLGWPGLFLIFAGLFAGRPQPHSELTVSQVQTNQTVSTEVQDVPEQVSTESAPLVKPISVKHASGTSEDLIFGRFVRGAEIGQGAMGTVYECASAELGDDKPYALKVLHSRRSDDNDFRERFVREASICQKLDHPNIVRCYEHGDKEGQLWMVMDRVDGGELKAWLEHCKRGKQEIVELFIALCDGLEHAHNRDVIHRDLKPENIILTKDPQRPVIADFGLAKGKHYDTITKTNTTLGTPIYMPPEQVTGGKGAPTGDLYSLGCILFESLNGKPPFDGKDVLEILQAKLMGECPPALTGPDIPEELSKIVQKLLQPDAEDRYPSAAQLRRALESIN